MRISAKLRTFRFLCPKVREMGSGYCLAHDEASSRPATTASRMYRQYERSERTFAKHLLLRLIAESSPTMKVVTIAEDALDDMSITTCRMIAYTRRSRVGRELLIPSSSRLCGRLGEIEYKKVPGCWRKFSIPAFNSLRFPTHFRPSLREII